VNLVSMFPAEMFAKQLSANNALQSQLEQIATGANISLPLLTPEQVMLSSATADFADKNCDMSYPRVCIFGNGIKNQGIEKFRSFSGQVSLVAEILASGDLLADVNLWIHCYVEAVTRILRTSIGDWGSGVYYAGEYEVQFQVPKAGGLGFVQSAKLSFNVGVSLS
jgi:hypothetical protein